MHAARGTGPRGAPEAADRPGPAGGGAPQGPELTLQSPSAPAGSPAATSNLPPNVQNLPGKGSRPDSQDRHERGREQVFHQSTISLVSNKQPGEENGTLTALRKPVTLQGAQRPCSEGAGRAGVHGRANSHPTSQHTQKLTPCSLEVRGKNKGRQVFSRHVVEDPHRRGLSTDFLSRKGTWTTEGRLTWATSE